MEYFNVARPFLSGTGKMILSKRYPAIFEVARRLLRAADVGREVKQRLRWFDHFARHGNVSLTCRYFGISRETFYRWRRRFNPRDLHSLEERSSRPHRVRRPTWSAEQVQAVAAIRSEFPRWGKMKLQRLLQDHRGLDMSASRIGRILSYLKRTGQLVEGLGPVKTRRARRVRPHATRKPRSYEVRAPGDIVQIDTLEIRPVPGRRWFQFTARDTVSRWDVLHLASNNSATRARDALRGVVQRMPFEVRAIQVDGGSEFMSVFEEAARELGLRMFVLPPRSPNLNAHVERAQRTHTEEFYECLLDDDSIDGARALLREWEDVYNYIRPHQSLNYLTPAQFVERWFEEHARKGAQVSWT
jgi:putative transposase